MLPVMATPGSIQPPSALLRALREVLRPVVRLLLRFQLGYPFLADFLKGVFVEVAESEAAGTRLTDSRVTVLTGVHRKDVRRLRHAPRDDEAPPAVSLAGQVIARWLGDDDFLDAQGQPRPLGRQHDGGRGPTFEHLVNSISRQDVHPAAVLSELERLGVVHVDEQQTVHLDAEAFVPDKGLDEKCYYLGQNARDHLDAAVHNVSGKTPPMFERSVYYGKLSPKSIAALDELARRLAMDAIRQVNRRAIALQRGDKGRPDATRRINFGAYFFRGDAPPPGSES